MNELEKELSKVVGVAVNIFNGEEVQNGFMEKLRQQYIRSPKAKHTKEEWEELKMRIITDCVLMYYQQDEKARERLGKLLYEELRQVE